MAIEYETECSACSSTIRIVETPMGFPGGNEREEAYCPKCGHVVASIRTSGLVRADLIDTSSAEEE